VPKRPAIPDIVTAGLNTVGVRMPSHPIALELIQAAGVPIAAPSANRFTGLSPTTAEHVREAFGNSVDVIDGGPSQVGIESTVVAIENGELKLLRPGMISLGDLEQASAPAGEAYPAPGMHERHYSPRTPLFLVSGGANDPFWSSAQPGGAYVWHTQSANGERSIQVPKEPVAYAAQLYAVLHGLDREKRPWIAVELPPDTAEWAAIHDRLRRAAANRG
jgi:L-threonylcarbamoyladenylate synthase